MSKSVPTREWMDNSVCAGMKFLYEKLPAYVVEHSLDLLEEYNRKSNFEHILDPEYLNRVTDMLIDFAKGTGGFMTTSASECYDLIHELNAYLDGCLYQIDIGKNTDIEKGRYFMRALPKS